MTELRDVRTLAVLGLGRSGCPAALLARARLAGVTVVGLDERKSADDMAAEPDCTLLAAAGVELCLGAAASLPDHVDLLVKSPGVPDESAVVREAVRRGLPIWSEVEFATRFLPNRLVAVTGTNGKTTTTALIGAMLADAGVPVAVAGNIGHALARLPGQIDDRTVIVAELSSFQLEHVERFRADVALLLNLTPDHIDRHGSYEAYVAAKLRVFENQDESCLALLNADDPGSAGIVLPGSGRRGTFSLADGAPDQVAGVSDGRLWVLVNGRRADVGAAGDLALRGDHNRANSLAAAAAAAAVGVPPTAIAATLRTFPGVEHRLEVVATVAGVTYVNDSKGTNVDATLKALTAYSGPVHLILGGYDKGADFTPLAAGTEGKVKQALLIGQTAAQLAEAFAGRRALAGRAATPFVVCHDLERAVVRAAADAAPGDVVLLSPACASWDAYRNYEERGEHFCGLVHELQARS